MASKDTLVCAYFTMWTRPIRVTNNFKVTVVRTNGSSPQAWKMVKYC